MKKNIFLLPVIFLISVFCFCAISCSSGFIDEKGQVNITFSESSLRNLMARGAISEGAEKNLFNDSDLLSDFPNKPKIEYQFYGCEGQITDLEDFNEDDFDIENAYVLNFYKDSTYEVYSSSILNELADEQEALINGISEKDLLSNPDFQKMLNDPFSFYEQAIVSKGNWSQSGNLISISETYFYDLQTGSLSQSASPLAINILLDSLFFNISSQSGVSLTFFNESLINLLDDEVENSDDKQNTEETTESQENSDKDLSIVVTLTAGDKNYEKTIVVKETDLDGSKSISFNNLTVGLNAKVTIVVYELQSDGEQTEYAKGESNDFVVQSGINTTTIKIKKVVSNEKEPEVEPEPDVEPKPDPEPEPDPDPDPQDKEDEIVLPSGTIVNCYGGQLKDSTTKVANYILALYENKKYAVYEFSDEFLADESNKEKYSFEGVKDLSGIIAVVSRMLENGTVISYGTYIYQNPNEKTFVFKYNEKAYYDKTSLTYKASTISGTASGDLSAEGLVMSTQSGLHIQFWPYDRKAEDIKLVYTAQTMLPDEYLKYINGGWLYFAALSNGTYSIIGDVYDDSSANSSKKIFAEGTYTVMSDADGENEALTLTELRYLDFETDQLLSGSRDTYIVLSESTFTYNTGSGIKLEFTLNAVTQSYPFTFSIKGFDKNDVTDLDGGNCNITLLQIKSSTVIQKLKSILSNDSLTDAQKAQVLIPVLEGTDVSVITSFQPGVTYVYHTGSPTNKVLDDGTIEWSGTGMTSVKEGKTYGVLTLVYFNKKYNSGYYEFDIGLAENQTLSSKSNEVEITVKQMDIPCNINFYNDADYAFLENYQIKTALTDIILYDDNYNIRESVVNEILSAAEESNAALEKEGFALVSRDKIECSFVNNVPYVTLYYTKSNKPIDDNTQQEEEKDPFEASGGGSIITDNRAVEISMDYDVNTLGLNNGQFTFTAKDSNGTDVTSDITDWSIQLLYKGKNVNQIGDDPYYETADNKLSLFSHIPLPSATNYQILVTAKLPVYQNSTTTVDSSQTFDIKIPDRHFYTIRDPDTPWKLSDVCITGVRNVVINGDVEDDDWEWNYFDQNPDEDSLSENLLWVLFTKNRASLESLTFNGEFTSPDYNTSRETTTDSPFSTMTNLYSFMKPVSLKFNNKAHIGNGLFRGVINLKEVSFTTSNSSIGDDAFRICNKLDTIILTGVSEIGYGAFADLEKLTEITIPASVTTIKEQAFINPIANVGLAKVTFEVTTGWKKVIETNETLEAWEPDFTNTTNIAALLRSSEPTMPKLIRE